MIPTIRRLGYVAGYLALGMLDEASDELEMIEGDDRMSAEVMRLRVDLYHQAKQWDLLLAVAKALALLLLNLCVQISHGQLTSLLRKIRKCGLGKRVF